MLHGTSAPAGLIAVAGFNRYDLELSEVLVLCQLSLLSFCGAAETVMGVLDFVRCPRTANSRQLLSGVDIMVGIRSAINNITCCCSS